MSCVCMYVYVCVFVGVFVCIVCFFVSILPVKHILEHPGTAGTPVAKRGRRHASVHPFSWGAPPRRRRVCEMR